MDFNLLSRKIKIQCSATLVNTTMETELNESVQVEMIVDLLDQLEVILFLIILVVFQRYLHF